MKTYRNIILEEARYGGLPVAYWPLDEVNGTTAHDLMAEARGAGLAGTLTGTHTLGVRGPISREDSRAVRFGGGWIGSFASRIGPGALPLTVEAWIYRTSSSGNAGVAGTRHTSGGSGGWALRSVSPTQLTFFLPSTDTALNVTVENYQNAWTHVAVTVPSSGTLSIYINGVSVGSATVLNAIATTNNNGAIGAEHASGMNPFAGDIAHVAIYDYVLAADRIRHHYLAGIHGVSYPEGSI